VISRRKRPLVLHYRIADQTELFRINLAWDWIFRLWPNWSSKRERNQRILIWEHRLSDAGTKLFLITNSTAEFFIPSIILEINQLNCSWISNSWKFSHSFDVIIGAVPERALVQLPQVPMWVSSGGRKGMLLKLFPCASKTPTSVGTFEPLNEGFNDVKFWCFSLKSGWLVWYKNIAAVLKRRKSLMHSCLLL